MDKSAPDASTSATRGPRERWLCAAGRLLLLLPLIAYAAAAIKTSVNIPFEDDFDSIGDFAERYASLHGLGSRLWWVLTAQHTQYKLVLMNTVVAAQYQLIGRTNYRALELLGDLAIPATVVVLWFLLARSGRPLEQRLWLFLTPCWIFLSMRYAETVNWAMSGLQNMAVIPLTLAAILFATSTRRRAAAWSLVFLALSVAASGSGFVAAIVVLVLLLGERRFALAGVAGALTLLLAALYAIHYTAYMVYAPVPLATAVRTLALFPFAFLGNAAFSPAQAVLLGAVLAAGFVFLTWKGWRRACPASFGGALFCVMTATVVAGGRYRSGVAGALAGHYGMYSLLLIALEYIAVVRLFVPEALPVRSRWTVGLALAAAASMAFCIRADAYGYRVLHARQRNEIVHLILWQRHPERLVLVPDEDPIRRRPGWLPIRIHFQEDLRRQVSEGLYRPPYTAADPLPVRTHSPATLGIEDEPAPARGAADSGRAGP